MIPGGSVLDRSEGICEMVFWGNGALRDTVHSIHLHGPKLPKTVPVNRGAVIPQLVLDGDLDYVSPACLDPGSGVRLVEDLALGVQDAVAIDGHLVNFEIVLPQYGSDWKGFENWGIVFTYFPCDTFGPKLLIIRAYVESVPIGTLEPALAVVWR